MLEDWQNSTIQIFTGIFAAATVMIGIVVLFFPPVANKVKTADELAAQSPAQKDDAYVTSIDGEKIDFGDRQMFLGTVSAVNRQQIPVEEAIITLQLVIGNVGDITQVVTDEQGVAAFEYDVTGLNSYYFEILDITGENWIYAPQLSLQQKLLIQ